MGILSSIDWQNLSAFFGEYGKFVTVVLALIVGAITLAIAVYRYLHANIVAQTIRKAEHDVLKRQRFLTMAENALKQAETTLKEQLEEIEKREKSLSDVRDAFTGQEHDLWCMHAARKPQGYDDRIRRQREKPIIMIANLKGGVGKTTLAANLAAHYSMAGKRVLLVDVDYQGSLSNMLLSADGVKDVPSGIGELLAPGAAVSAFNVVNRRFEMALQGASIVPAKYEFASLENRLLVEYLLQDDEDDGRYRLAKMLQSEEAKDAFDLALIDAPPRLTAGAINAFCASTHLLVPTVYDLLSAEAVGTFLNGARVLRDSLNPGIDLLGVVGMLTMQQKSLATREENARRVAVQQVTRAWSPNHYFFSRHIPRRAAIAEAAGEQIAYFREPTVKGWFDELGGEISSRLGWGAIAQWLDERDPRRQAQGAPGAVLPSEHKRAVNQ